MLIVVNPPNEEEKQKMNGINPRPSYHQQFPKGAYSSIRASTPVPDVKDIKPDRHYSGSFMSVSLALRRARS